LAAPIYTAGITAKPAALAAVARRSPGNLGETLGDAACYFVIEVKNRQN